MKGVFPSMGVGDARVRASWTRGLCRGLKAGRGSLLLAGMIQRTPCCVLVLMQLAASDSDTEDTRGSVGGGISEEHAGPLQNAWSISHCSPHGGGSSRTARGDGG